MEQIYCWKHKKALDIEDNIYDLNLCIDQSDIDLFLVKLKKSTQEFYINCNEFPMNNPQHLDVGFEDFNKEYDKEIVGYKKIIIRLSEETMKPIIWEDSEQNSNIKLSQENLKSLIKSIQESKKNAYIHDNYLESRRLVKNDKLIDCKIIVWAGMNGNIVYC
jgi:hypothetical protein